MKKHISLLALVAIATPVAAQVTSRSDQPLRPYDLPLRENGRDSQVTVAEDPLGDVWEMEEVADWRGVWIRRGRSPIFDGYWVHPRGERVLVPVEMRLRGRDVTVHRRHANGQSCTYRGQIHPGGREVSGRYSCSWEQTPMGWNARILRMEEVSPAILRDGRDYPDEEKPDFR